MKNKKVITVALLIMAAGTVGAAAQATGPFYNLNAMDYPLQMQFSNPPRFAFTTGVPILTTTDLESLSGAVATDGSGRIAGQVYMRAFFGGPINHTNNYGAYAVSVVGNTSNRGTNPMVKINLHGNGYTFDGVSNHNNASLSLTFHSTNVLVDVPPIPVTVNSTNYSLTFADGTTQLFTNGPATRTNSAFTLLSGPIHGSIGVGTRSPVNGGKAVRVNETATMVTARTFWTVVNGTNLVEQITDGSLGLDVLSNLEAQVVQPVPGTKLFLNANLGSRGDLFMGTGSANTNTGKWSASFSGVAFARGSTMRANGTLGPLIVAHVPIPNSTNFAPQIVPNALVTMTNTGGRFFGQPLQKKQQFQGVAVPAPRPGS